ncbi:ATP-binding cassette domain-containing protein [Sporolactobacillus sp. CQH2019]|uniref:ATP-binding cassette domain-containing protein n=1 Tax=Sporolactobacillus sp. CQH2019 TaxID=3023512 RepID=UPI002367ABEA|nr:ATP-binding cassette domain-containing protein [Sporolactobacillus sp. CQH2019]MDD9149577.1 ATP-binding cassette domain-containing protein [Sporolactobacillus sp. CQH2019]
MENIIEVRDLQKEFSRRRKTVRAVQGISLNVKQGEIFGFLGPNGAGKTTTMRMLTTLLPIGRGDALVAGFSVKRQPRKVRRRIGYVSQLGGSDLPATGRENLILAGRLYGISRNDAEKKADELIELFDLGELQERKVKTYSGGQKRRLEIALAMIHRPEILFLDEPTTGLDLQNRTHLWDQIRKLKRLGTTVFLTTHYLEEADELADHLSIMDHGKMIAEGTPGSLKRQIQADIIIIKPQDYQADRSQLAESLSGSDSINHAKVNGDSIYLYVENGTQTLPRIFTWLEKRHISLESVSLSQPSLDDVFLKYTGRSLRDTGREQIQ